MDDGLRQIWTVGHSTRSMEEFLSLLRVHEVQVLADVRRFPGSRRYPHYNQDSLSAALANCGIGYVHCPELGGRRSPRPDSPNTRWRNKSFRGYADYMMSEAFMDAIDKLLE